MPKFRLVAFLLIYLVFTGGSALAACGDQLYTLETPFGFAGGEALRYREGVLELAPACFEAEGLFFESKKLRYQRNAERIYAEAPVGKFQDWTFSAERLDGANESFVLTQSRFEREGIVLQAEKAEIVNSQVKLNRLFAEAFGYRFWAERGRLEGDRFIAEVLRATPCRTGEALRLSGERAVFDLREGRLLFEESAFTYYGLCLARPKRLLLDTRRPPKLAFPIRLAYGDGFTFGFEGLPLYEEGIPLGAERTRFTLLAEGIGGKNPRFRFGVTHPDVSFSLKVGANVFSLNFRTLWLKGQVLENGRAFFELRPEGGLVPFVAAYSESAEAALAVGLYGKTRLKFSNFALDPYFRLVYEPERTLWVAGGGRLAGQIEDVRIQLSGTVRLWNPRGFWGVLAEREFLRLQAAYDPITLTFQLEPAAGWSRLELAYDAPFWLRARAGFGNRADRRELVFGYRAPNPAPGGFALSPELGYDLGLGRVSRLALELAYADGCLVYRLGARYIAEPWPDEPEGFFLRMGVALP